MSTHQTGPLVRVPRARLPTPDTPAGTSPPTLR
ncbi:hypothetical protein GPN2_22400 [Streptomyces murinus]